VKTFAFLVISQIAITCGTSHAQDFSWATGLAGSNAGGASITSTSLDGLGALYVCGYFNGTIMDPTNQQVLSTAVGTTNAFLAKFDTAGYLLWFRPLTSEDYCKANCVLADEYGGVYVGGFTADTLIADQSNSQGYLPASDTSEYCFLAKFDSSGNFAWITGVVPALNPSTYISEATHLSVSGAALYLTGKISCTDSLGIWSTDFKLRGVSMLTDSIALLGTSLFVIRLDTGGIANKLWVLRNTENILDAFAYEDALGSLIIGGSHEGKIDLDPGGGTVTHTVGNINSDGLLVALDTQGIYQWSGTYGSVLADRMHDLACYDTNILAVGSFEAAMQVMLANGTSDTLIPPAPYISNGLLCKYYRSGGLVWAKQFFGSQNKITRIKTFSNGDMQLIGNFTDSIDVDLDTGIFFLRGASGAGVAMFIARYDEHAKLLWCKTIQHPSRFINAHSLNIESSGAVYVGGFVNSFSTPVDFDPGQGVFQLGSIGNLGYILKLADCVVRKKHLEIHSCEPFVSPMGNIYATSGTYIENYYTYTGCDSLVTYILDIDTNLVSTLVVDACNQFIASNGDVIYSSGVYSDTFASVNNCDSVVVTSLTVHTISDSITSSNDTTLAAYASGLSYQWYNCNNNLIIAGATMQTYSAPMSGGSFSVIVSSPYCTDTSLCILVAPEYLQYQPPASFTIGPNPSCDLLYIKGESLSAIWIVTVFSIEGKFIKQQKFSSNHAALNVSKIESGSYIVDVRTDLGRQLAQPQIISILH
jgi:hypothetical protein